MRFLGLVPSTEAPRYYREIDVLVLPSLTRPNWVEQFGRVLIEAMACGVAVVGSSSGEIPWVIGDAGVIFPEGDADALRAGAGRPDRGACPAPGAGRAGTRPGAGAFYAGASGRGHGGRLPGDGAMSRGSRAIQVGTLPGAVL